MSNNKLLGSEAHWLAWGYLTVFAIVVEGRVARTWRATGIGAPHLKCDLHLHTQ